MKTAAAAIVAVCVVSALAQEVPLRERPNAVERESIFQPTSATSADGLLSIRAAGAYAWNITPIIGVKWDGSAKSLLLAVEVIGQNLTPSTAVFVIDGKTFVAQSAEWQVDSRGNLVAFMDKPGLVRNLAAAHEASVTVFAPAPLSASFRTEDLGVFRAVAEMYDSDGMKLAEGEATHPEFAISASERTAGKMKVTVLAQQPSTTPYNWEMDGRVSVTCTGSACDGYYRPPRSGTQQIQGAILRLLRPDSSIVIAQCVSKVDVFATTMTALDAASVNDPNSPTIYRDCRVPLPNTIADAQFHKDKVKLSWHFDGARRGDSETYEVLGVLRPVTNH